MFKCRLPHANEKIALPFIRVGSSVQFDFWMVTVLSNLDEIGLGHVRMYCLGGICGTYWYDEAIKFNVRAERPNS